MRLSANKRARAFNPSSAFTLLEIMIVVAIIAIFMSVGIPSIARTMRKNDLSRAINDTIEGCKTARDRAILQGIPWVFIIKENGEMALQAMPGADPAPSSAGGAASQELPAAPPSLHSGFPRQLGEDVMVQLIDVNFVNHMEAPEARVRFFPNGIADEFTVVFAYQGKQRSVKVDIITGYATEFIRE
jgi:prepilin-type N-terminal cleavage/methylation domain-containing protein